MFRNVGSKCFCHDSKNSHTSGFFFKHNQQDGEEYSDRLLATMLGTDRPTVSLAAGILQNKQIIEYTRGTVQILSRTKLEASTYECYEVIQQYNHEIGLK